MEISDYQYGFVLFYYNIITKKIVDNITTTYGRNVINK